MSWKVVLFWGWVVLLSACTGEVAEEVAPPPGSAMPVEPVDFFDYKSSEREPVFEALLDSLYQRRPDSFGLALRQYASLPKGATVLGLTRERLYGLADSIWWVEVNVPLVETEACAFLSNRRQLLFDHKGRLMHQSKGLAAQFLPYALDSLPLYTEVLADCQGEGRHLVYRYQEGALVNLLNPLLDDTPLTYDANPDTLLYQGFALRPRLQDVNDDGYPDLLLEGTQLQLYSARGQRYSPSRPYRRLRTHHQFLYEPAKEYFVFQHH